MKKFAAITAALLATTSMSACSFDFALGGGKVKASDIQTKVASEIKAQTGKDATVSCPGDLEGKAGATLTCTAAVGGKTYPVNVNVTEAKGKDVKYSWKLDTSGDRGATTPSPTTTSTPASSTEPSATPGSGGPTPKVTVSKENVENEIARVVREQTGKDGGVDCPGSLKGEVGANMLCKIALPGAPEQQTYRITVTRVEGTEVYFDIKKA